MYGNFTTTYTYNDFHLVASATDIDGQVVKYEYDPLMRLKTIKERCTEDLIACSLLEATDRNSESVDCCANKTVYNYTYFDADKVTDNTVTVENRYGYAPPYEQHNITTTVLDGLGRTIATNKINHTFDGPDISHQNTNTANVSTFNAYNNRGLLATQTNEEGDKITFNYYGDPLSRLKTITDAEGFVTTKLYGTNIANEIGYKENDIDAIDYFVKNTLNKETTIDADDNNTSIFTDRLGRTVAKMVHKDGQKNITYTKYDDKNRVTEILPPGATAADVNLIYKYTYDGADNIKSKKYPIKVWWNIGIIQEICKCR